VCSVGCGLAQTTVLYETHFERAEGYDPNKDLAGQRGWLGEGGGGNGLVDGMFVGLGQQAYIGSSPGPTNGFTSVWRPVGFDPAPADYPLVKFEVKFQVASSTEGPQDDFRWSIYNQSGNRLFSLDLEGGTGNISYRLEDFVSVPTGLSIAFDLSGFDFYQLAVWMDFRRNSWSAFLNDVLLVNSEQITQTNVPLNFGDADAVWLASGSDGAGNNYMVFDDYLVTAEPLPAIPGYVEPEGISTNGFFTLLAYGQKGAKYSVDVSTDFTQWFSLGEYMNTDGVFEFEDNTSDRYKTGFYRLRPVPVPSLPSFS